MKEEYDFTKAEKGKFYISPENTQFPIYLEEDVLSFFQQRISPNQSLQELVNSLLRKDIAIVEKFNSQ